MDWKKSLITVAEGLVVALVGAFLVWLISSLYKSLQDQQFSQIRILSIIVLASAISAILVYFLIRRFFLRCKETSRHLRTLQTCLNSLPPGLRPAVAGMSSRTAENLCRAPSGRHGEGETITLTQYMQIVKDVAGYAKVRDVTYIATTLPSEWGRKSHIKQFEQKEKLETLTREESEKLRLLRILWDDYFQDQKTRKHARPSIRMRRLFFLQSNWTAHELDSLNYLKQVHRWARIGLLVVRRDDLPTEYRHDLALILCDNGGKWIIRSDYAPSSTTVKTCVVAGVDSIDATASLFRTISDIYNADHTDRRLLERGNGNEPDLAFLQEKCGISLVAPETAAP